jgi:hypothetical protein
LSAVAVMEVMRPLALHQRRGLELHMLAVVVAAAPQCLYIQRRLCPAHNHTQLEALAALLLLALHQLLLFQQQVVLLALLRIRVRALVILFQTVALEALVLLVL